MQTFLLQYKQSSAVPGPATFCTRTRELFSMTACILGYRLQVQLQRRVSQPSLRIHTESHIALFQAPDSTPSVSRAIPIRTHFVALKTELFCVQLGT